jgi:hypothetical protein
MGMLGISHPVPRGTLFSMAMNSFESNMKKLGCVEVVGSNHHGEDSREQLSAERLLSAQGESQEWKGTTHHSFGLCGVQVLGKPLNEVMVRYRRVV